MYRSVPLPHSISTSSEAAGLALLVAETTPGRSISVCLCQDGTVQTAVSTARRPVHLIDELEAILPQPCRSTGSLLIISALETPLLTPSKADLHTYYQLTQCKVRLNRPLIDWLTTDGDEVRSFAYLLHPNSAWPNDPPSTQFGDTGQPFDR